jgi:hypothetical protein
MAVLERRTADESRERIRDRACIRGRDRLDDLIEGDVVGFG